ncbi:GNAT family N-acetyltransferase, partial [Mesorhizobium sp. M7A.T.Ca.TU.009.02.1.1]
GITHRPVEGASDSARQNGARLLEACPMDLSRDSRSIGLFVGSSRIFEKAGFERLVERKAGRPLMRLVL